MSAPRKTSNDRLVSALRILSGEIESPDGVANVAIAEGADRIDELAAELSHVTIDRDNWRRSAEFGHQAAREEARDHDDSSEELAALRARVAELEAALRPFADAAKLLEHAQGDFGIWARCSTIPGQSYTITVQHLRDAASALSRADSAAPAKHPDTEPEVIGEYEGKDGRRYWWTGGAWIYPGQEVAVIAARKQGGAE